VLKAFLYSLLARVSIQLDRFGSSSIMAFFLMISSGVPALGTIYYTLFNRSVNPGKENSQT
jgi:hypothetical protein